MGVTLATNQSEKESTMVTGCSNRRTAYERCIGICCSTMALFQIEHIFS